MIAARQAIRSARLPIRSQLRTYAQTHEAAGKTEQDQNLLKYVLFGAGGLAAAYTAKVFFFSPAEAPTSASGTSKKPMESNKGASSNSTSASKGDFHSAVGSKGQDGSSFGKDMIQGDASHRGSSKEESGSASAKDKHKEAIEKTRSGPSDGSASGDRSGGAMRG